MQSNIFCLMSLIFTVCNAVCMHYRMNLKENLSLLKLQTVINHIRQELEHKTHNGYYDGAGSRLCTYMLPPQSHEQVHYMGFVFSFKKDEKCFFLIYSVLSYISRYYKPCKPNFLNISIIRYTHMKHLLITLTNVS